MRELHDITQRLATIAKMTKAASIHLDTTLDAMPGLSAFVVKMLASEGILTVGDLIACYPTRHEDRRHMAFKGFSPGETPVCHHVRILKTRMLRFGKGGGVFEAVVETAQNNLMNQQLTLRWFKMSFLQKMLAVDMELMVYGRIKEVKARLIMDHPDFEVVRDEEDEATAKIHTGRIVPIYRLRGGLKQKPLRASIWRVIEQLDDASIPDLLPKPKAAGEFSGMSRGKALRTLHHPLEQAGLEQARRYLALEEFYLMQLRVVKRKLHFKQAKGWSQQPTGSLAAEFLNNLPFKLTAAQQRCLEEIQEDMAESQPMNRLLHGDVGSGKTVVALAAMLTAVESGQQAALMAPTQILAEQHYANALRWLEPLGVRVTLRTGSKREDGHSLGSAGRWPAPAVGSTAGITASRRAQQASGLLSPASEPRYGKRRNLPHFERPWAKYMITFSTIGRKTLQPAERSLIMDCILHWRKRRYELYAACVMPDHAHLLIEPSIETWDKNNNAVFHSLTQILHTIKSFTAHEINKLTKDTGNLWEPESFDRMIRSESDLQEKFLYIVNNPLKAGIVSEGEAYPWCWTPDDALQDAEHDTLEACSPREINAATPLPSNAPHLFIGTHALLYDEESLSRLGLVVIDEQHKFGVAQRARLIARGRMPDVLVMTATPIPRTLTLTLYGDLDVSTIDQRPKERGKVITAVREITKVDDVTRFVRAQLDEGRQCYIVYPLIEESEKLDASAAKTGFTEWSKRLAPNAVELLHGRMTPDEKDSVMRRFRKGDIQALVSTTVIEVGVDVPNATMMLIHDAERFGLAQLHQLRGRIGRGTHTSYAVLFIARGDKESKERLHILEETNDGFRIAEEDLLRRGPGDVLGQAQSGQAPLCFGEMLADTRLVTLARRLAMRTLTTDPDLAKAGHAILRPLIHEADAPAQMSIQ